ncbi:MAG TPA: hypothetical protein VGU03_10970 [Frateuria sp.]|uniref:hypothetical protein n=1 Tax=Frateuria sp. TaxID=2211372 RepID=UPI002DED4C56|nr:hypothetical protein [Frateuria sp.]
MAECVHFLELAIAIQSERDAARRLQLLRELPVLAREPVLAWLWADVERPYSNADHALAGALTRAANDG